MGIKYFLAAAGRPENWSEPVSMSKYRGMRLAIDGTWLSTKLTYGLEPPSFSQLHQQNIDSKNSYPKDRFYNFGCHDQKDCDILEKGEKEEKRKKEKSGRENELASRINNIQTRINEAGATSIWFFDGKAPVAKEHVRSQRKKTREKSAERLDAARSELSRLRIELFLQGAYSFSAEPEDRTTPETDSGKPPPFGFLKKPLEPFSENPFFVAPDEPHDSQQQPLPQTTIQTEDTQDVAKPDVTMIEEADSNSFENFLIDKDAEKDFLVSDEDEKRVQHTHQDLQQKETSPEIVLEPFVEKSSEEQTKQHATHPPIPTNLLAFSFKKEEKNVVFGENDVTSFVNFLRLNQKKFYNDQKEEEKEENEENEKKEKGKKRKSEKDEEEQKRKKKELVWKLTEQAHTKQAEIEQRQKCVWLAPGDLDVVLKALEKAPGKPLVVQAPGEAEQCAAWATARGFADVCCSDDYDVLPFGAPLILRGLGGHDNISSNATESLFDDNIFNDLKSKKGRGGLHEIHLNKLMDHLNLPQTFSDAADESTTDEDESDHDIAQSCQLEDDDKNGIEKETKKEKEKEKERKKVHAAFIDLCILCGCDYTPSVPGVGGATALRWIRQYGSINNALAAPANRRFVQRASVCDYRLARRLFSCRNLDEDQSLNDFLSTCL